MILQTTGFRSLDQDLDKIMTGHESYPIIGDILSEQAARELIHKCKGLNKYWNCLEKAEIVSEMLRCPVGIGSLRIRSADNKSEYAFNYSPPFEFHAWALLDKRKIVDISLPGAIEAGLLFQDQYGPALKGRTPSILAGEPLDWTIYKLREVIV